MIAVPVGHDHEVEVFEVDPERAHVALEDAAIVAGVEENALSAILHQGRKPPVGLQLRTTAEGVVQDGDPIRRMDRACPGDRRKPQQEQAKEPEGHGTRTPAAAEASIRHGAPP